MSFNKICSIAVGIIFVFLPQAKSQLTEQTSFDGPLPEEEPELALSFVEREVLPHPFVSEFLEAASATAREEAGGRFAFNQPELTPWFSRGEIEPTESGDTYEDFTSTTYLVKFPFQEGYRRGFDQNTLACGILHADLTQFGVYDSGETVASELTFRFLGFVDSIPVKESDLLISDPIPTQPQLEPEIDNNENREDIWFTLRRKIDSQCKTSDWKEVRHKEVTEEGVRISTLAYVEAYVIQHLVYVEADDKENRSITLYYWDEGVLKSVFELRQGSYTETDGYDEVSETYNFRDGRLVEWKRSPGGYVDPQDETFYTNADWIADSAISRSEVIYEKIGAD